MNKLNRIAAPLAVLSFFLLISTASAQDLTEQQRQEERCQTNKKYLAEYENEINDLNIINGEDFEVAARELMSDLSKAIANGKILSRYNYLQYQKSQASGLNLEWDSKWDADKMAYQKAIRNRLIVLIQKKSGKSIRELEGRISYLQTQMAFHRARLAELKCDEKTSTPTVVGLTGNWNLLCCNDAWGWTLSITNQQGDTFSGSMAGPRGGKVTNGLVRGNTIEFDRLPSDCSVKQHWVGQLVSDSKGLRIINGSWTGCEEERYQGRTNWHAEKR